MAVEQAIRFFLFGSAAKTATTPEYLIVISSHHVFAKYVKTSADCWR